MGFTTETTYPTKKKMTFRERMARGFTKVGELKRGLEEKQFARAQAQLEREKVYSELERARARTAMAKAQRARYGGGGLFSGFMEPGGIGKSPFASFTEKSPRPRQQKRRRASRRPAAYGYYAAPYPPPRRQQRRRRASRRSGPREETIFDRLGRM